MEQPIEVLRVEQSGISKELGRFRACDPETRSLYCREWAQYIYKKHFVWNAKTQEEIVPGGGSTSTTTLKAGNYQINFLTTVNHQHHHCDCVHHDQEEDKQHNNANVKKKERSCLLGKNFEDLAASWTTADANGEGKSLLNQIMTACQSWMTLPSGYTGLPNAFESVEFNPYPDAIPLVDDAKDPSQLLDPLIIERQSLCLPSDCFHLLKNLTGDILLSHSTPTCNHSKPTAKTPADLEVDRAIFNENEAIAITKALKELSIALELTWYPLNQFLKQLGQLESRRAQLMGKGCQANIDAFFADQTYVSFVDRWTGTEATLFKNKKSTEEEINKVDTLFQQHLEGLKSMVKEFMSEFVPKVLEDIHVLTNELWKMVVPTIYELGERMAKREASKGSENAAKIGESLKSLDVDYLKKMESTKEVDSAKKRITAALNTKVDEYMIEINALFQLYKDSARPNLSGRLEKLNNKDFKKKIKKVEGGYYSIRQTFRYEVTEKIFPESLFCKFALVCLEPLLQEGEMVEAVTIETEVKRFMEAYKDLWQQRSALLHRFEQGVQTGRRELAGVLGKLFLKEGMRIQGDNLALKRQNTLLKSMGMGVAEEKKSLKNKKNAASSGSGTSSPAQQQGPDATIYTTKKSNAKKNDAAVSPSVKKETKKAPAESVADKPIKAASPSSSKAVPPVKTASPSSIKAAPVKPVSPEPFKAAPVVQKSVVAEVKKPVVAEVKKPVVAEVKKPVVAEVKKPVVAEVKKPVVAEVKKPVVAEVKKPVVEEIKKPVVEEIKKPVATEPRPKVKSSKIPAPAPIVEPKAIVLEKKKKEAPVPKSNKKKDKEAPAPVIESKKEVVAVKNDDIEDWDTVCASVNAADPNNQKVEETQSWNDIFKSVAATKDVVEVQDWNDLRAQVQLDKKKEGKPWGTSTKPVEMGWSNIAAKKPTVDAVNTNGSTTAVSSETPSIKENDVTGGWGVHATVKNPNVSPTLSNASSAWSTTATVGGAGSTGGWGTSPAISVAEKPTTVSNGSWGTSPVVTAAAASEKPAISAPPGWGTPVINEKALVPVPSSWNVSPVVTERPLVPVPSSWNVSPVVTERPLVPASSGWGVPLEKPAISAPLGWAEPGVATKSADISPSLGGWGRPVVPATWSEKNKTSAASTTSTTKPPSWHSTKKVASGEWDHGQLSWTDEAGEKKTTVVPSIDTAVTGTKSIPSTPISSKPPGLTLAAAPPSSVESSVITAVTAPLSTTMATTSTIIPPFGLIASQQPQYQEPLPATLQGMSAETLIMISKNLHQENGSLIQSVYAMQQEMSMMTNRYAEIMSLAREREAQTLQLFESRKQTEMEDARRYVLNLEARIKQLEGSAAAAAAVTAGFGNQDLFAGYREEMRTTTPNPSSSTSSSHHHHHHGHHGGGGPKNNNTNNNSNSRRLWQKNTIVRCGNCGETGHKSAECKTNCRYCGSTEHLSEACPMN